MAAANYSTNLVEISPLDTTTGVTPIGAGGSQLVAETDFYIQNGLCVSKPTAAQWKNDAIGGVVYNNAAGITVPTDGAVLTWIYWWGPGVLATTANGGAEIVIGSGTADYNAWYVTGSEDWEFGGWRNYPVNPSVTSSRIVGTPTTTLQYFGWQAKVASVSQIAKGNPYGIDAIRYGRCDLVCTDGDSANGYATFLGAANWDNQGTLRYGLLIPRDGAFYSQGLFQFGTATTPVDFRDSNRPIFIANTQKVTSNFNTFEVLNTGSNVSLDSISFTSLGAVSRGRFLVTDNATVTLIGCIFTDFGTCSFLTNTTINQGVFRQTQTVLPKGASITSTIFDDTQSTSGSIQYDSVADGENVINCTFSNNTVGPAVKITAAGTYTFVGHQFNNNTTEVEFSGTGTCTIVPSAGSNVSSLRVTATGGGTITVETPSVNVTLTGLITDSEVRAYLGANPATATELAGTESSGTSFTFSQNVAGQSGYIQIFHVIYQPVFLELTYSGVDQTIPIQQILDRQYSRGSVFTPG